MIAWLKYYCILLTEIIPHDVYLYALIVFFVGMITVVFIGGLKKCIQFSMGLLLLGYILLIYSYTVFFRLTFFERDYNFTPFWSYGQILNGRYDLLAEGIMNIVIFLPVGLFLGGTSRSVKWWMVLMVGLCLSFLIEFLQFFLKRGFSEFDDVFHNSIGCLMGYGAYCMAALVIRRVKRQIT